jgi:hypothetical protein
LPEDEGAALHHGDDDIDAELDNISQELAVSPALAQQALFDDIDEEQHPPAPVPQPNAAQQPRHGAQGPKVYSSPACLSQLCGPHGNIRLDCNAHRFIAECSIGYPDILLDKKPHHFKTSGQNFTVAGSWQLSLIYAHKWLWTKYTLLPDGLRPNMPAGTLPQPPGEIPQSVMEDLSAHTIPYLPQIPKKY